MVVLGIWCTGDRLGLSHDGVGRDLREHEIDLALAQAMGLPAISHSRATPGSKVLSAKQFIEAVPQR